MLNTLFWVDIAVALQTKVIKMLSDRRTTQKDSKIQQKTIRNHFKTWMRFVLYKPKTNFDSSNNGDTSRGFFENYGTTSEVTQIKHTFNLWTLNSVDYNKPQLINWYVEIPDIFQEDSYFIPKMICLIPNTHNMNI